MILTPSVKHPHASQVPFTAAEGDPNSFCKWRRELNVVPQAAAVTVECELLEKLGPCMKSRGHRLLLPHPKVPPEALAARGRRRRGQGPTGGCHNRIGRRRGVSI